ncbi:serine/threonine-protein kinase [Planosporangium mesophilum]|uniref:Protein kinase domain-containing protein n=1 Tax=Planosporangium mesophilum TaxID=689768 RepID=A0A8J3WZR4_9ACTN|nr:serine/threonine-protein kinase [Planosporangium mesophilum]NJC86109.1 protein kinase [Planosporangium mesophilum]GII21544.1 hypothetical protein Pme01_11410 [Planosporangium mesophilum]
MRVRTRITERGADQSSWGPGDLRPGDPRRVGSYRVVRRLGAGGMGTVFLALDRQRRPVALKLLREHLRDDPVLRERFAGEIAAAARVAGPGTARVLDADPDARTPFLVTEYVEGMSLRDRVDGGGPLGASDAHAVAVGVAAALAAIHAAGVVHRDLKPRNVMLSPVGVKVIDFGVAGAIVPMANPGSRFGTPGWLAPEQMAGHPGGPAADVYAWGLLVAWAATGRHPVPPHRRTGAPDLSGLPPHLLPAVQAALRPAPAARPGARDLVVGLCGPGAPAHAPTPPPGVPATPPALPRRRRWRPVPVVLVTTLLAAGWLVAKRPDRATGTADPASRPAAAAPLPGATPVAKPATSTAKDGKLTFTVTGVHCGDTTLGDWPVRKQAKGRFCLVDLTVTNTGGQHAGRVFMGSQRLVDSAGTEYSGDEWAWVYSQASRPFTAPVDPGRTVEGALVFDTPADARATRLIVRDSPLSRGTSLPLPSR